MIDHIGGILCILAAARIDNEWAALIAAVEGDK